MNEDFGEFARRDDELWDEIDCVIPITTELGGGSLISAELSVELSRDWIRNHQYTYRGRRQTWVRFRLALSPP